MTPEPKHDTKPERQPEKPKKPRKRRNSLDPTIIVAIIAALGGIIVAVINPQILSSIFPPPAATPTATPIPFAGIQSLDVIQNGTTTNTLNPGEKIILTSGANVLLKVNFISNTDVNNLVFHWEFCHPEKNTKGQGTVEIPYKLSEDGKDCIKVKIEREGQFLDVSNFFVSTK